MSWVCLVEFGIISGDPEMHSLALTSREGQRMFPCSQKPFLPGLSLPPLALSEGSATGPLSHYPGFQKILQGSTTSPEGRNQAACPERMWSVRFRRQGGSLCCPGSVALDSVPSLPAQKSRATFLGPPPQAARGLTSGGAALSTPSSSPSQGPPTDSHGPFSEPLRLVRVCWNLGHGDVVSSAQ